MTHVPTAATAADYIFRLHALERKWLKEGFAQQNGTEVVSYHRPFGEGEKCQIELCGTVADYQTAEAHSLLGAIGLFLCDVGDEYVRPESHAALCIASDIAVAGKVPGASSDNTTRKNAQLFVDFAANEEVGHEDYMLVLGTAREAFKRSPVTGNLH